MVEAIEDSPTNDLTWFYLVRKVSDKPLFSKTNCSAFI